VKKIKVQLNTSCLDYPQLARYILMQYNHSLWYKERKSINKNWYQISMQSENLRCLHLAGSRKDTW